MLKILATKHNIKAIIVQKNKNIILSEANSNFIKIKKKQEKLRRNCQKVNESKSPPIIIKINKEKLR